MPASVSRLGISMIAATSVGLSTSGSSFAFLGSSISSAGLASAKCSTTANSWKPRMLEILRAMELTDKSIEESSPGNGRYAAAECRCACEYREHEGQNLDNGSGHSYKKR